MAARWSSPVYSVPEIGEIELFRPIYYLGCKTSHADSIVAAIDELDPHGGRACDLFAGTGAVAAAMAATRDVTTIDIQEYSRLLCSAQLDPAKLTASDVDRYASAVESDSLRQQLTWCFGPMLDFERNAINSAVEGHSGPLVALLEAAPIALPSVGLSPVPKELGAAQDMVRARLAGEGLLDSPDATVTKFYGGVYFAFDQAIALDVALTQASKCHGRERTALVAAALSVASDLVNTVGKQFAQPIRPRSKAGDVKQGLGQSVGRDRNVDAVASFRQWLTRYAQIPSNERDHEFFRMDYADALTRVGPRCSVLYADPPYTRDHYSRFYHVLETMCLRDNPEISTVSKRGKCVPSRGLYRKDRHQSPFCIRSAAPRALAELFSTAREMALPIVLSYSPHESGDGTHPRVLSATDVLEIAKKFYRSVEVEFLAGSTHNKLNRNDLSLVQREHAEMLVRCRV